ncbi:hypothetical protein FRC10_000471 [Ceratobasidium sp. 414]|nr:hypothetical protein FRC10_000471 [Ceratobasidium sp. 414]
MTEEDVWAWRHFVLNGQAGLLSDLHVFRYLQPRPGQFEISLREEIHPQSELRFPPESLAYARYLVHSHEAADQHERPDELPAVKVGEPYQSLTDETQADLTMAVGDSTIYARLLNILREHDEQWPYQPPETAFLNLRHGMPLLKPGSPAHDTHVSHFVQDSNGFLPRQFFATSNTKDKVWRLYALLRWCEPSNWRHQPSGTLMAGPYGIKWPVLVIIFLRLNELLLANREGPRPAYDAEFQPEISKRDSDDIRIMAEELFEALQGSSESLSKTVQERSPPEEPSGPSGLQGFNENDLSQVVYLGAPILMNEWEENDIVPEPVPRTGGVRKPVMKSSTKKRAAESGASPPKKSQKTRSGSQRKRASKAGTRRSTRSKKREESESESAEGSDKSTTSQEAELVLSDEDDSGEGDEEEDNSHSNEDLDDAVGGKKGAVATGTSERSAGNEEGGKSARRSTRLMKK